MAQKIKRINARIERMNLEHKEKEAERNAERDKDSRVKCPFKGK